MRTLLYSIESKHGKYSVYREVMGGMYEYYVYEDADCRELFNTMNELNAWLGDTQ